MKLRYKFALIFLLFFVVVLWLLESFFPLNNNHEEYVPDIINTYIDFFLVLPIFFIINLIISELNIEIKIKTYLFILNLILFLSIFLYFLPNRDLRLFNI